MAEFIALGIAELAIDGLVWGFAGYLVFRLLGGGKRWWIGILATCLVSLGEDALFAALVRVLDLRIGNAEIADLLGSARVADLVTFDPLSDVIVSMFAVAIGFVLAGFFDERREARREDVARGDGAR